MRLAHLSLSYAGIAVVTLAMPVIICLNGALAATTVSGGMDYEIPLSELDKVRKEAPPKRATSEPRKKKKNDAKVQEPAVEASPPKEPVAQAPPLTVDPSGTAAREAEPQNSPAVSEPLPDSIRIHHSPYSFIVAGKRTIVQAVINSNVEIKSIACLIRVRDGGAQARVAMLKENGTRFTYMATIPGLAPESRSLRYTIVAVDSLGRENRSQEFSIPVTASAIVPGWQTENMNELIVVEREDGKKPLEGFSDPAVP
jgi:hypothetical protein